MQVNGRGETHHRLPLQNENFSRYTDGTSPWSHCSEQLFTMEALAAIGVASNVAQFVEHAIQFTRLAHKLASSASGPISEHEGITSITNSMARSMEGTNEGNTDPALKNLAGQCLLVAANVQSIVNDLSKKPEDSLIRSLHKTGKTIYKQKELQELSDLLSNMRAQVSQHLLALIR